MPLFEVAVLEKPTKEEEKEGKTERLALGPQAVVAVDGMAAAMIVAMKNKDLKVDAARMEVLVRPFA